jgi:hypothetical protein
VTILEMRALSKIKRDRARDILVKITSSNRHEEEIVESFIKHLTESIKLDILAQLEEQNGTNNQVSITV